MRKYTNNLYIMAEKGQKKGQKKVNYMVFRCCMEMGEVWGMLS